MTSVEIWRCPMCFVKNDLSKLKCAACGEYQPNLSAEEKAKADGNTSGISKEEAMKKFLGNTASAPSTGGFAFTPATTSTPSTGGFAFGGSTNTSATASTPSTGGFAFGGSTGFAFTTGTAPAVSSTPASTTGFTFGAPALPSVDIDSIEAGDVEGNGTVLTFGSGDMAQLGLGHSVRERRFPAVMKSLEDEDIVFVASGALHNVVLTAKGEVYTWGCNDDGALGRLLTSGEQEFAPEKVTLPKGEVAVSAVCGASHTVVLTASGRVYSWGSFRDASGVVGFDTSALKQTTPVEVKVNNGSKVISIAAGESHTVALTDSGKVYYWGDVYIGRRGSDRFKRQKLEPFWVPLRGLAKGVKAVKVFAGGYSCFVLLNDGNVLGWGPNNYGQIGIPRPSDEEAAVIKPTLIEYFRDNKIEITKVACSSQFSIFLSAGCKVYAAGRTDDGRLGQKEGYAFQKRDEQVTPLVIPTLTADYLSSPEGWPQTAEHFNLEMDARMKGPFPDCVSDIGCGEAHALAVTAQGRVFVWGNGDLNQVGNGKETTQDTPYWVRSNALSVQARRVLQAVGGSQHSMILTKNAA